MYIPEIYKNENPEQIRAFLKENSFGILVTNKEGVSLATHIPLEYAQKEDGTEILHAHISKANDQCKHIENGADALCIFNGPHSYVSSSWYDFEEVPTWNYIAVHIRGTFTVLDKEGLWNSVKTLMHKYEDSQEQPVRMEALSEKTLKQMNGIIGFEIAISSIEATYKLSQNRDDKNHTAVVDQLHKTGDSGSKAIAKEMDQLRSTKK
ncbi:FMN-binding negative transcriptional regulator [uncultured Dokdonia sp.]|uniref:FMN-binding negative transcriptional regulator n=1 Tax=uncultured Dokdonia sp. TaxID=575653 RepID=UPI002631A208|nr:FMN-binding negative transcriptional regulator [uncultured Dokdonia sp.]